MILPDVNVLVYAYRKDVDDHPRFRDWIHRVVNSGQPYGMSELGRGCNGGGLRVGDGRP